MQLEDLLGRLNGADLKLDHLGLTLGAELLSPFKWRMIVREARRACTVHAHPGRPDWLFLFPDRSSKFEIAIDPSAAADVTVQVDLQTRLPLARLQDLFKPDERQHVDTLSDYAVSIPMAAPWKHVALRLDLRAASASRHQGFTQWLRAHSLRSARVRNPATDSARKP